jgi:hypothetical protein
LKEFYGVDWQTRKTTEEETMAPTLTNTPADLIAYQNELVRTKNYDALGRMNKIAIGPSADWQPPAPGADPFIDRFGRLIDLRSRFLPIAASKDRSILLITAPLLAKTIDTREFTVGLPDVPDPSWKPGEWTPEESGYRVDGTPLNEKYPGQPAGWEPPKVGEVRPREIVGDPSKRTAPMLPQRLEDRAERPGGRLGVLEGTNFLVFQPVLRIAYQPEIMQDGKPMLQAAMWTIECEFDRATNTCATLLVDPRTGEAHFFGGTYNIVPTE